MVWKNFKLAWRNLWKHKAYSLINISGLTVGLATCLLLLIWVLDEWRYDRFHPNADRIYRIQWEAKYGDNSWKIPFVPVPLAPLLNTEFPEVATATQMYKGRFTAKQGNEFVRESNVLFVDNAFFDVFTIPFLAGAPDAVMDNSQAVLVTAATAKRYFGADVPMDQIIGKTILRNDNTLLEVVGVVESFPRQSHLQYDFIASLKNVKHLERRKTQWGSASCLTYFLMEENGTPEVLAGKIQAFVDQELMTEERVAAGNYTRFPFEPIKDIHLKPNLTYLWLFGLVAGFILLLACINFINLATARAITRAREVGVRKVLGSTRQQLMGQFFSESALYVIIAGVLGALFASSSLPLFNQLSGKELSLGFNTDPYVWGLLFVLMLVSAALTGIFPAYVLSAFLPSEVISGKLSKNGRSNGFIRQGLVVFQFGISCALIISTLVVNKQLHYLQNQEMGFNKEQVLIVRAAQALQQNYQVFFEKIQNFSLVKRVAAAQYLPGDGYDSTLFEPEQPSNYETTSLSYSMIDHDFVDALQLEIVEGRNFDLSVPTDSSGYLINEKAVERLGWTDPIGKVLKYGGQEGRVLGVVKDFNFSSLHDEIEPIVMMLPSFNLRNILIRLQPGNLTEQIQQLQNTWKELAPSAPFEYAFLDSEIQSLYEQEQRLSSVFTLFSAIAIFIACLGLFGLAAFMAKQRTKEIGIRKVLGASITHVVGLLSKDFLKLVGIAILVAIPLAWLWASQWLENFAYHIDLKWWMFAVAGLLSLLIAFLTVSFQSIQAAIANPVQSLRNE